MPVVGIHGNGRVLRFGGSERGKKRRGNKKKKQALLARGKQIRHSQVPGVGDILRGFYGVACLCHKVAGPSAHIRTDGWHGYAPLTKAG